MSVQTLGIIPDGHCSPHEQGRAGLISIGEFIPAHDLRAADRPIPEGIEVIRVLHGARALRGQLE